MKVVAIVPAYMTGPGLLGVLEGAARALGKDNVLVVDDGSPDGFPADAGRLGYNVVRHDTNRGKGEALKTGFEWALSRGYSGVVTLDGDGQHDPGLIPDLLRRAESKGADIVVGSRRRDVGTMPVVRVVVNWFTSGVISRLAGQRIEDSQSGYRYISSRVLAAVRLEGSRYDLESEILVKAARKGFVIDSVPIPTVYGEVKSSIRPFKDAVCFWRMVLSLMRQGREREIGHTGHER
ncbi:MAG: glycosyltransferase family 2 protein [Candidatus Eisenbacteria bacterium]|nr:glycosyltransferase family 2 protein [Candidatus Eisenbacteria bacterium]